MIKKLIYPLVVFTLVVLTACSSLQLSTAQSASSQALQNIVGQPVKNKLAVGVLELEGTGFSITAEQSRELLPLWQAVKSLNGQKTTATEEMAALYDQIQASMTTEQIQYIDKLDLTANDLDDLAQKYASQNDQTTQNQTTTGSSANSASGGPQGGVPGLDMPPDAGMGGLTSGGPQSAQTTTTPQAPAAAQSSSSSLANSNITFASAVIKLLQQRSGS
jgi:hypothetical protein